ncbi:iron hydrogenase 1 [Clostridium acetireducens DSM 10703]|jgi:iron only hydrogenase large subunit-like protein|uniref:Iron hydrogenase 1 n=1 Tax=Clostridium acetireducens DSM 10703 TaxID=1121290 RepID=A0A1E8EW88_9CLOT|nr:[Fe-Fe] hydrogenase large subunit C-terminal domain-containing protein [Clostridium acetireducens]OFI01514.1 iron hydrogenase 1 [Clostridium acetireducens DSM 10703]
MKKKYNDLFKSIVKSYYEGTFDEKINELLSNTNIDKNDLAAVISSLCGVNVDFSKNYLNDLKKAIETYKTSHKVVEKVKHCSMDCIDKNGKTLCQKSCPFDAILLDKENHTTYIDEDKCTDCGFCVEGCTTGGILDKVEFLPLANLLKSNSPVIASVAPAISGQFGDNVSMNQLRSAFKKIGFTDMIEVSFFADMLTLKEAVEFDHHIKNENDFMITSCCCPMWVGMLSKIYDNLVKDVSPSVSPMIASGRVLKKLNTECKVVFVGPCIAKKAEAKQPGISGAIDFVLTFEELKSIFDSLNIKPEELAEDTAVEYASKGGRLYARTGGVSIAVAEAIERIFPKKYENLTTVQANGVKECKEILSKAEKGEIKANFIEGMGCIGGCVGGPKSIIPREKGKEMVDAYAEASEIKVAVDSECMKDILKRIGIESIEDFKSKEKVSIFEREFK